MTASPLRRFKRDEIAASAVEFALIAPIMLMMLLGGFEISRAMTTQRKVVEMAGTVNRLVALTNVLTEERLRNGTTAASLKIKESELASYISAASAVMFPYPADRSNMQVSVERIDQFGTNQGRIAWSYDWQKSDGTANTDPNEGVIPFRPPQNGVLRTTITYTFHALFSPVLSGIGLSEFNLTSTQMGGSEGTPEAPIDADF